MGKSSSLRADAPSFELSPLIDEDFYINLERELEEERESLAADEDGIPFNLQLIEEEDKPRRGRGIFATLLSSLVVYFSEWFVAYGISVIYLAFSFAH